MLRLVTDSTSNLPDEFVSRYNIEVVPLKVQFGSNSYREGSDITEEEFFRQLPQANPLPTTSQPSPNEFEEAYRKVGVGENEILSIHISSDLSGTYNSALNGAESFDKDAVRVVDTRNVSAGLGLHVLAAARMIEAGRSRDEIVAELERLAPETNLVLTVDTLEYLRRGGRIGGAAALIGGLFNIKPLIAVKGGKLEAQGRARSRKKAIEQLVAAQVERYGKQPLWGAIAQALAPDAAELEALARSQLNLQEMHTFNIGPVVTTHTGPGVLGIVVMPAPTI